MNTFTMNILQKRTINSPKSSLASFVFGATLVAGTLIATPAQAADLIYNFYYDHPITPDKPNTSLPGTFLQPDANGKRPVFNATFAQDGPDKVKLTIVTNFSDPGNFIDQIGFNYTGSSSLTGTCFAPNLSTAECTSGTPFVYNPGAVNVAGGGNPAFGFDLLADFPPPPGGASNVLGSQGESLVYTLMASGLTPEAFKDTNSSGFYASAHVQGLVNNGSTNIVGKLPPGTGGAPGNSVPGPLPVLGAAAAFGYSRKMRSRINRSLRFTPQSTN